MEPLSKLEPLTQQEIIQLESLIDPHWAYPRLWFTARLGAAYEQATKLKKEQP